MPFGHMPFLSPACTATFFPRLDGHVLPRAVYRGKDEVKAVNKDGKERLPFERKDASNWCHFSIYCHQGSIAYNCFVIVTFVSITLPGRLTLKLN